MYESKMKSEETDHLFKAILSLKTEEECYRFNGSYDGTRSLPAKVLDHMAKSADRD